MQGEIKKFKFKESVKFQIEVVSLKSLVDRNKPDIIKPHRTDFYHIFLFENCSPTHFIDFDPVSVQHGTLLFINKDSVHQFDRKLEYNGYVIVFTNEFFCTNDTDFKFLRSTLLFNNLTAERKLLLSNNLFKQFSDLRIAIQEELALPADKAQPQLLKNLLYNFLLLAEREKEKPHVTTLKNSVDTGLTLSFKDLVDENYSTIKNVFSFAEKLNISEKRLGKATSTVFGKKPKEIIDERIVLEAKRLLAHGSKTIKEIGFTLGFDEPTNFIKYFRKHTGKTPVEFRESFNL
jgi:AraC family transcriptional activator of pobA